MSEGRKYLRFPLSYRIEHWVAMGCFTILAITGLVQKFALARISVWLVGVLGGIETVRIIHRGAAIVLMLEVVYHVGGVGYRFIVQRQTLSMIPSLNDLRNAWQALRYYFGKTEPRPQQGRFTFEEKAEYWAFAWGTIIMAITGFIMWNPIATTRYLPGQAIPAAKAAHGNEALLAVLAIILWHFYHVHIRQFNQSMFTGHLSEEEMIDEHPQELADRKAGVAERVVAPEGVRRRRRIYLPVYGLIAVGLTVAIFFFATFEQTAIDTVPPPEEDVLIFAPFTPTPLPSRTPTAAVTEAVAATSWEDGIAELLQLRCGACHGGDSPIAGFTVSTYERALQGGASGPGVVPGDPAASEVAVRQQSGSHPGQLSEQELEWVLDWIEAGAPLQ